VNGRGRVLLLVHTPKSAGSAFQVTAASAGWARLSLSDFLTLRGRCIDCRRRPCVLRRRSWRRNLRDASHGSVIASIGHLPLGVARRVAQGLRARGVESDIVMTVRPSAERLASLFRFSWSRAIDGGLHGLVSRGSPSRLHLGAVRVADRIRLATGVTHRELVSRRMAILSVPYCSDDGSGLRIDATAWLAGLARWGSGSFSYWMREFCGLDELRSEVASGGVTLIPLSRLDEATQAHFGVPSLRSNVTPPSDPEVERALHEAAPLLARLARTDAPYDAMFS
jgi:hypothetical protein